MNEQKKQWQKPVLIVIGRGKPEENVLAVCKGISNTGRPNANSCMDEKQFGNCNNIGIS
jgi:hypothetical protein